MTYVTSRMSFLTTPTSIGYNTLTLSVSLPAEQGGSPQVLTAAASPTLQGEDEGWTIASTPYLSLQQRDRTFENHHHKTAETPGCWRGRWRSLGLWGSDTAETNKPAGLCYGGTGKIARYLRSFKFCLTRHHVHRKGIFTMGNDIWRKMISFEFAMPF